MMMKVLTYLLCMLYYVLIVNNCLQQLYAQEKISQRSFITSTIHHIIMSKVSISFLFTTKNGEKNQKLTTSHFCIILVQEISGKNLKETCHQQRRGLLIFLNLGQYYKVNILFLKVTLILLGIFDDTWRWSPHHGSTRARSKVFSLAYVKFGTSSHWVGTQRGSGVTATLAFWLQLMAPWTSAAAYKCSALSPWVAAKKPYISVAVTPAPIWVPTQWQLVPSY